MNIWPDIFDQTAAVQTLRSAFSADRLPHGLIFTGPVGVGKFTTALVLASAFLCENRTGDSPCGRCPSCQAMETASHPDLHVVTRELIRMHDRTGESKAIEFSATVVREEVVRKASLKSTRGVGKVFILRQPERMNPTAQNSLLKTLEEPAGRALIILPTDQPGALLSTIASRCQTIRFGILSRQRVIDELVSRGVSNSTAADAARLGGNSLGVAMRWIEDGVIGPALELEKQLDALLTGHSAPDLADRLKSSSDTYAKVQIERDPLGSTPGFTRDGLQLYLGVAAEFVRSRLRETDDADTREHLCGMIDAVARAEMMIDSYVNTALLLQELSLAFEGGGR